MVAAGWVLAVVAPFPLFRSFPIPFTKVLKQSILTQAMAKYLGSIAVAALVLSTTAAQAVNLKQKPLNEYIQYTSVPGYFLQDSNSTNQTTFDFVRQSLFTCYLCYFEANGPANLDRNQFWSDQSNLLWRCCVRAGR